MASTVPHSTSLFSTLLLTASVAAADPTPEAAPQSALTPPAPAVAEPAPQPVAAAPTVTAAPLAPRPEISLTQAPVKCEPCEGDEHAPAEGAGMFVVGAVAPDFSALNNRLRANGYERLPRLMTLIGGEGRAVFDSGFVAGIRGAGILAPSGSGPAGMQTHFGGGFGLFDFGLAFVHTQPLLLTLTGDIGGYATSLGISDDQNGSFDDVLRNPRRSTSLSRAGLLVGLTLGCDARVPIGPVERARRGFFTMGLRIGALFGPALGSWGLTEDARATGGPASGLSGGFVALAIGFGGGKERHLRK